MPDALPKLLAPVTKRLHAASHPRLRAKMDAYLQAVAKGVLSNPRLAPEATLVLVYSVINDGVTRDERLAATERAGKLEETTLGEAARGEKEKGNRVWENGWCVFFFFFFFRVLLLGFSSSSRGARRGVSRGFAVYAKSRTSLRLSSFSVRITPSVRD
jgi:hypothetical protein